jgi:FkbM family methyltransferase
MFNNICLCIIVILIIILIYGVRISDKTMLDDICTKKEDNTIIELINNEWTSDFKHRFEVHEPYTNTKLKELLKELPNNSYIIDVGAHVGDTGLYLCKILKQDYYNKNIKVIFIDPDNTKINFIKNMAKKNNLDNLVTLNYGVNSKKEIGNIDKSNHPGGWKINKNKNGSINLDSIDNLCKNMNISMIHIDVEGMEYDCLLGAVNTISNVKYIMIELNSISERTKEIKFLKKNNFKHIPNENIEKENGNNLFKNTNLE